MANDNQPDIVELAAKLTNNELIFSDNWLIHRVGSTAYKFAYKNCKSEGTAKVNASKLLKKPRVKAYIDARLAQLSDEAGITVKRVLEEESRLAFSDLREIFDGETAIKPSDLPEDVARAIAGVEIIEKTWTGQDGESEVTTTYKYKFWDKGAALNRLEKHLGMHKDSKLVVEGGVTLTHQMSPEMTEKLDQIYGRGKKDA